MKKIVSILLSLVIVFSLAACSSDSDEVNIPSNSEQTQSIDNKNNESVNSEEPYKKFLSILGNPMVTLVSGNTKTPNKCIYKIDESGVFVRFISINALKEGDPVNILHTTDFHFNKVNDKDIAENNPCVESTRKVRKAYADEITLPNTKKVLSYADKFDAVAITGDNIDYLTWGSLEMMREYVFEPLGNKVIASIGGHDTTRLMETGTPADPTTLQSRYDIIQSYYPHNIVYSNMLVKNRVMLIQMDNGSGPYIEEQLNKLQKDIEKARKENLVILIFQHEPFATGKTEDSRVMSITGSSKENFYRSMKGGSKANNGGATKEVYNLITSSADVVKGVFCGHLHDDFYTEIKASYINNGDKVETTIPQIVLMNTASKPTINVIMVE